MDENQNVEVVKKEECPICDRHPVLKSVLCGLLIFAGAYCAFYTVSDWHFKRMLHRQMVPFFPGFEQKMMRKDIQMMDKMFKPERDFIARAPRKANLIHIEQEEDEYKVIIDLTAVDNNADNIQVSANGNILTIAGRTVKKSKNNEQISEFQQSYMFGDNVRLSELKKETEGRYYIITIPIVNNK